MSVLDLNRAGDRRVVAVEPSADAAQVVRQDDLADEGPGLRQVEREGGGVVGRGHGNQHVAGSGDGLELEAGGADATSREIDGEAKADLFE